MKKQDFYTNRFSFIGFIIQKRIIVIRNYMINNFNYFVIVFKIWFVDT